MISPDIPNAIFEVAGIGAIAANIAQVLKDKKVHGVSPWAVGLFMLWGWWNLYFYSALAQVFSFYVCLLGCVLYATYIGLLLYYRARQNQEG